MAQKNSSIRDIIDNYEWFWLPIIKRELAQCTDEEKFVYGVSTHFNDKLVGCNGLFDAIVENNDDEYEISQEEHLDISANNLLELYKFLHEDVQYKIPHPHQKRWHTRLGSVITALQDIDIQKYRFTNFEHIYDVIRAIFTLKKHPKAFLTIYDMALRIGYNHAEQILPSKFVYLYGDDKIGSKGGATKLFGKRWVNQHLDKDYPYRIETRYFMDKFPNLPSWEIESILCIYAKRFKRNMPY